MSKSTLCAVAVCLTLAFSSAFGQTRGEPELAPRVSMLQLLSNPAKYDGKRIAVIGYLKMGRDGDFLFFHQVDSDNMIFLNAYMVMRTEEMGKSKAKLNERYVEVVGVFHFGEKAGRPGQGVISEVEKCEVWSDPSNPRAKKLREL